MVVHSRFLLALELAGRGGSLGRQLPWAPGVGVDQPVQQRVGDHWVEEQTTSGYVPHMTSELAARSHEPGHKERKYTNRKAKTMTTTKNIRIKKLAVGAMWRPGRGAGSLTYWQPLVLATG